MNPENGGQSSSKLQQQAAAAIARRKVLASYTTTAQKSITAQQDPAKYNQSTQIPGQPRILQQPQQQAQYQTQTQPLQTQSSLNTGHLKDQQTAPRINSESWRQYHTAWQDYYQKYYSSYYSNAAKDYIAKARLKDARNLEEEREMYAATKGKNPKEAAAASNLRTRIRLRAAKNTKKAHRHRRLIPIAIGVLVTLTILFLQYNRLIFAPIMAYMSPGDAPASEIETIDPTVTRTISPEPKLLIPKLNIDVPVHFGIDPNDAMSAMNNGVAHYRIAGADAYPGEIGNLVITGHSAGDIYSSNPYKYIFSGLERLEAGDQIYVNYNSTRYIYKVTKKEVIEPTNVAALIVDTDKPLITLVTCTPLGTSRYRLLVTGELIYPVNDEETETPVKPKPAIETTTPESLPSNEPSFFEGIWNWLTGQ